MLQGIPFFFRKSADKLLLCLMVFPFVLTSCFPGQPEKQVAKEKSGEERANNTDISHLSTLTVTDNITYSNVLDDLDRNDLQNIDLALTLFSNNKADSLSRDSMLVSFTEFMTSEIQGYYDGHLNGNQDLIRHFENKGDQSETQKLISMLATHGIKLSFREGDFYLEPDLAFIYDRLNGALTVSSRDYLQVKISLANGLNTDSGQPVSVPDSLAHNIIAWEDFMVKNPGYLLKDEIQAQYIDAMAAYLSGTEQLPLFDPDTKMIEAKYQSSYLRYLKEYPDRGSARIVKKFYDLLDSKGFKYDEELDSFLSDVNFIPTQTPQ